MRSFTQGVLVCGTRYRALSLKEAPPPSTRLKEAECGRGSAKGRSQAPGHMLSCVSTPKGGGLAESYFNG